MNRLPSALASGARWAGSGLPEAHSSLLRNIFRGEECAEEALGGTQVSSQLGLSLGWLWSSQRAPPPTASEPAWLPRSCSFSPPRPAALQLSPSDPTCACPWASVADSGWLGRSCRWLGPGTETRKGDLSPGAVVWPGLQAVRRSLGPGPAQPRPGQPQLCLSGLLCSHNPAWKAPENQGQASGWIFTRGLWAALGRSPCWLGASTSPSGKWEDKSLDPSSVPQGSQRD